MKELNRYVLSTLGKRRILFSLWDLCFITKLMNGREIYETEYLWLYIIHRFVALSDGGSLFSLLNIV